MGAVWLRSRVDLTKVGRLPEVAETADASAMLLFAGRTPDGRLIGPGDVFPVAAAGNALGSTFERWTMLEGRAAHPWEVREATASFLAAEKLKLRVAAVPALLASRTHPAEVLRDE